jgi:hypothetical protein
LHRVGIIWNTADSGMALRYQMSDAAARTLGIAILPFGVREPEDIDHAFEIMARDKPDARSRQCRRSDSFTPNRPRGS